MYVYKYSLLAVPYWLFPIGCSLLATPLELVRQVLDSSGSLWHSGGFYDRKTWLWQDVEDTAFLAASGIPGKNISKMCNFYATAVQNISKKVANN